MTKQNERINSSGVKVTDILKMSQDISGNWLKKEAEKRVVSQDPSKSENKSEDK